MTKLLILAALLIAPAHAQLRFRSQASVLDSLPSMTHLPHEYPLPQETLRISLESIPPIVAEKFARYRAAIFPNLAIRLYPCFEEFSEHSGLFMADYVNSAICVYPRGLELELKALHEGADSLLVDYLIIHELSHLIHEISILGNRVDSKSVMGHYSVYRTNGSFTADGRSSQITLAESHAEVDQYTYLLFRRLGMEIPGAVIEKALLHFIAESAKAGYEDVDAKGRLQLLRETLQR